MQIVVLAGGVGGSRFTAGVRRAYPDATVTIVGNTADDITIHGLRVCPDLDTLMYTLGGGGDTERGWGRVDESWRAVEELRAYGAEPTWFGLGDRDLGTHLVRTGMLAAGVPLSEVTARLCARWWADLPGLRLLPMTDDPVETYVEIADADGLDAVTMRAVAERVGIGAMTLYGYVPGKAELVELMGPLGYAELVRHCEAHVRSRSALALHPADPR